MPDAEPGAMVAKYVARGVPQKIADEYRRWAREKRIELSPRVKLSKAVREKLRLLKRDLLVLAAARCALVVGSGGRR